MKKITPLFLIFGALVVQLTSGMNYVIFPLTLQFQGLSNSMIGFIMSCDILSMILLFRQISLLVKRLGVVNTIILSSILRFLIIYLLSGNNSVICWMLGIFCYGLMTGMLLLVLQTWLNITSTGKMKGVLIGLYSSSLSFGIALGPIVLQFIGADKSLHFLVSASIALIPIIVLALVFRNKPEMQTGKQARIGFVFKHSKVVMFSAVVGGFCFFGLPSFLTIYGMKNGLSVSDASLLLTMFMIGSVTLGMFFSSLSAFFNKIYLVFVCVCISVVCAAFLSLATYAHLSMALGLLFIWGGCMGGIYALGLTLIGEQFRKEDQISANMTYTLMDSTGGLLGLCLIGISMDLIGSEGLSYTIVVVSMCYLIFIFNQLALRFKS